MKTVRQIKEEGELWMAHCTSREDRLNALREFAKTLTDDELLALEFAVEPAEGTVQ